MTRKGVPPFFRRISKSSTEIDDNVIFPFWNIKCGIGKMSYLSKKQRLKIALGGILSLVGFLVLALTYLVVSQAINIQDFIESNLLVALMASVGVLDIFGGILLLRSR